MGYTELTQEESEFLEKFYAEQKAEFQEKMQQREQIQEECEELARQRATGFHDKAPEKRREGILDKMCARISALEAENEDYRDIACRFNYMMTYLSEYEPEVLHSITVAFGHDSKHRNLFMNPYEYVPPFLAETVRERREWAKLDWASLDTDDSEEEAAPNNATKDEKETGIKTSSAAEPEMDEDEDDVYPDYDAEYGWLSPTGKFFHVPWAEHSIWSEQKVQELGYATWHDIIDAGKDDDDSFNIGNRMHYANDVLIEHGWVLIHDPLHDAPFHHAKIGGPTKKQKEYLFDMYMRIGKEDAASALYQDDDM